MVVKTDWLLPCAPLLARLKRALQKAREACDGGWVKCLLSKMGWAEAPVSQKALFVM